MIVLRAWHRKTAVDRDVAASQSKNAVYKVDQDARRGPRQKRAEVLGSVVYDAPGSENARKLFRRYFQMRIESRRAIVKVFDCRVVFHWS